MRNRIIKRARSCLLALALATGFSATVAAPAHAGALECDTTGGWYSWSGVATPWKVTHATRYEHFTYGSGTYTKSAAWQMTLKASVSYSVEGSVGVQTPIGSLGAKTNLTLAAEGSGTTTSSVSVTETMDKYGVYIYYDGHRKASGDFTYTQCVRGYYKYTKGSAASFNSPTEGAIYCPSSPPSGSLGYLVKQIYC